MQVFVGLLFLMSAKGVNGLFRFSRESELFHQYVVVVVFSVVIEVDCRLNRCGGRHLNDFRSRIKLDASVL